VSGYALVADHDRAQAHETAAVLRACGFEVGVAGDAPTARAAIDARRPDVLVLEAEMAEADGTPLLEHLKANPPQAAIPIIAVSAGGGREEPLAAYQRGADYLLVKPYTRRQLLHGLTLVLGHDFGD